MTVIGVTGPSGSGKGAVSAIIASLNAEKVCVIDADKVYHNIISPPSNCLDELVSFFGNGIINSDGTLCRPALADLVFGDNNKEKLLLLNKITHKYVVQKVREDVSSALARGCSVCVIDAPLLIEAGIRNDCSFLIAVLASKEIRAGRISARDGISREKALERINSQKSDEFYISNSDGVIFNDGDLEKLRSKVRELLLSRGVDL
jgi:dephospho-CoA kinase